MRVSENWWLLAALALTAAILGFAVFGDLGYREVRRLGAERRQLEADVAALRAERQRLERDIAGLNDDPRAVERRAREGLGMIRKGETVFLLPERHGR